MTSYKYEKPKVKRQFLSASNQSATFFTLAIVNLLHINQGKQTNTFLFKFIHCILKKNVADRLLYHRIRVPRVYEQN